MTKIAGVSCLTSITVKELLLEMTGASGGIVITWTFPAGEAYSISVVAYGTVLTEQASKARAATTKLISREVTFSVSWNCSVGVTLANLSGIVVGCKRRYI